MHQTYTAIGLMSGSSLDGLDICCVQFFKNNHSFQYKILHTDCVIYDEEFREKLRNAPKLSAYDFAQLHVYLGSYFAEQVNNFIRQYNIQKVDFICSHGQTIFHQPNQKFTTQIGCGATLAQHTGISTVADLRMSDVAQGGQGAPIVPIAEKYLFEDTTIFLNIGGICNLSFHLKNENKIIAYDVCAGNTLLNHFALQKGFPYDENGNLASTGKINNELLAKLNEIDFLQKNEPKSLGTEHVIKYWIENVNTYSISIEDKLATSVEHIAQQIAQQIKKYENQTSPSLMITGGGALNTFLVNRIKNYSACSLVETDMQTIQYKEALSIAFFGLLRILEIPNCLQSVTGANKDVIGGSLFLA